MGRILAKLISDKRLVSKVLYIRHSNNSIAKLYKQLD